MDGQLKLDVDGPAVSIGGSIHWNENTGWRLSVWSLSATESLGVPDEERAAPASSYERLTLLELLDVLDAEAHRRRGF